MSLSEQVDKAASKYASSLDKEFRDHAEEDFATGYIQGYEAAMEKARVLLEKDRQAVTDMIEK